MIRGMDLRKWLKDETYIRVGYQPIIWHRPIFYEKCIKIKEIRPRIEKIYPIKFVFANVHALKSD